MVFTDIVFYTFAAILLFAALRVITTRNPVVAALHLVLAFFTAAGIWLLLEAEFLAIALVLVYVGAVMVLFLFVVMMLDINLDKLREGFWEYLPMAGIIGLLMAVEMVMVLSNKYGRAKFFEAAKPTAKAADYSNTAEIGRVLYSDYLLPFELASVVLLVAIVAAIVLTLRDRKESKSMHAADQVLVKKADRLRIVSMASESTPVEPTSKRAPDQSKVQENSPANKEPK
ncbi:MAG TPA: NADH-quinone oxidoreductase subunit J [Methylotenera sp.]|nr:NADH-quinone oxidoreductase subunit J [Methylotenera sp.]